MIEQQIIFDENGIKIFVEGLDYEGLLGTELKLYIEKNSSEGITLESNQLTINDTMMDAIFTLEILAGKKEDLCLFMDSDLKESYITEIKNMEVMFHVFHTDTWDDIFDTEFININFEN